MPTLNRTRGKGFLMDCVVEKEVVLVLGVGCIMGYKIGYAKTTMDGATKKEEESRSRRRFQHIFG